MILFFIIFCLSSAANIVIRNYALPNCTGEYNYQTFSDGKCDPFSETIIASCVISGGVKISNYQKRGCDILLQENTFSIGCNPSILSGYGSVEFDDSGCVAERALSWGLIIGIPGVILFIIAFLVAAAFIIFIIIIIAKSIHKNEDSFEEDKKEDFEKTEEKKDV